ncbi:hypothetical protein PGT21_036174 [Puccinia graminis f. sp. tritici]|uniref:Uncharacterized protein n=1 Tax=Puccinia graminis f. sp. tritici TaxID=56615 RepID=A0A5B0QCX5_PUCGR|nr:hypothetical protein PGT21_036174 [Puccinia graminis f. sp. tritici]
MDFRDKPSLYPYPPLALCDDPITDWNYTLVDSHSLLAVLDLGFVKKLRRSTIDYIPAAEFLVYIYVVAPRGSLSFLLHPTLVHFSCT